MSAIKNVAIAGASGALGQPILEKLIASGEFNIRVLRRTGSSATFPAGVDVVDVDFTSVEALTAALRGQDALVSTVNHSGLQGQSVLVEAAVAAGIKRLLPSEFGSDLGNPNTRKIAIFQDKIRVREQVEAAAAAHPGAFTYTYVCNAAFLDWGLQHEMLLKLSDGKPTILDGGDLPFSTTTLDSVADAVVGILRHPAETANRTVYIHDMVLTQNKLLALARRAAPHRVFEPQPAVISELIAKVEAQPDKSQHGFAAVVPYLYRSILDPAYGGKFEKVDNELLGLKGKTDEDVVAIFKTLLK